MFLLLFFLCEMSSFIRFFHHLTCCILSVTVVAAAVADGTFLPYQVVLTGKTKKCLPPKEDRKLLLDLGWSITWSDYNWSNLETSKLLFDTVHLPYLLEAKKKLKFPEDYPGMLIYTIHH